MSHDAPGSSTPDATPRHGSLASHALLLVVLYVSTPNIATLAPKGMLDGLGCALLVLALCHVCFLAPRRIALPTASALVLAYVAYNVANGLYHDVQQTYLSVHTLYLAGETLSVLAALPAWKVAVAIPLTGLCLAFCLVLCARAWPRRARPSPSAGAVILGLAATAQVVHAGVNDETQFRLENAVPLGHMIRSSGYVPFVRPDGELTAKLERDALVRVLREDPNVALPSRLGAANLDRLRGYGRGERVGAAGPPTVPAPAAALPANARPNVLVLVLESVRASEMGLYGAERTATPFLDALARESLWAERFYATTNFTVKSEHAIHCSALDHMIGPPVAMRGDPVKSPCLPRMLRDAGYRTLWFHGNDKAFYNRAEYLPKIGFEEVLSRDELDPDGVLPTLGWGLPDPLLLDMALDRLEAVDGPFYAQVLTVSNHMPFDMDWDIDFPEHLAAGDSFHDRYRRGIHYTDRAVEGFYRRFADSALAEDTLLVITGDHGVWTFDERTRSRLDRNERFFRVPFILRTPDGRTGTLSARASHLDVAPTVAELVGVDPGDAFLGRSLVDPATERAQRVVYLMTEQALSYRLGDRACLPSVQCESNLNCHRLPEDELPETACYRLDPGADPLRDPPHSHSASTGAGLMEDRALFDYSQMALELGPFVPLGDHGP